MGRCCDAIYFKLHSVHTQWARPIGQAFDPCFGAAAAHDVLVKQRLAEDWYAGWIDEVAEQLSLSAAHPRFAPALCSDRDALRKVVRDQLLSTASVAALLHDDERQRHDSSTLARVDELVPRGGASDELELAFARVLAEMFQHKRRFRAAALEGALEPWTQTLRVYSIAAVALVSFGARGNGTTVCTDDMVAGCARPRLDDESLVASLERCESAVGKQHSSVARRSFEALRGLTMAALEEHIASLHATFADRAVDFDATVDWSIEHCAALLSYERLFWDGGSSQGWSRFVAVRPRGCIEGRPLDALEDSVEHATRNAFVSALLACGWRRHRASDTCYGPFGWGRVREDAASSVIRGVELEITSQFLQAISSDLGDVLVWRGALQWTRWWLHRWSIVFAHARAHGWTAAETRWWCAGCARFAGCSWPAMR